MVTSSLAPCPTIPPKSPQTAADLVELLRDYGLLQSRHLAELNAEALEFFQDAERLARYMVQRDWLTMYQARRIASGRIMDLVRGPYRILDSLGEGGTCQVFKAKDAVSNAIVALKILREEFLSNREAVSRFAREMQVIVRLRHPNIVRALAADQVQGEHYFAMEYLQGTDLAKLQRGVGALEVPAVCDYIRQAALGLHHAHEHGLVHRDVKPGNLFLTKEEKVVKVLDLGLSRSAASIAAPSASVTQEGSLIGTPDYVSPEQALRPRQADRRSDIYSLGCTFYHLLIGQPPFPVKSAMAKVLHHQRSQPPAVSMLRADVPEAVTEIVDRMMAKNPQGRFSDASQVAEALQPFASDS